MSNYAETNGDALLTYPYTFSNLQADNPYTDFGSNTDVAYWYPQTEKAQETGNKLHAVIQLPQPDYDPTEQNCAPKSEPELVDGEWVSGWTVTNKTPEEKQQELNNWRSSTTCTPFQGRMALSDAGLLASAQAVVDAADEKTKVAWEYALVWNRTSPMIESLAGALGLTDVQVDDLFKSAQQITA